MALPYERKASAVLTITSATVVVGGLSALAGWWFNVSELTTLIPSAVAMAPNTAACFILAGLSLWLIDSPRTPRLWKNVAVGGTIAVMAFASITLFGYLSGRETGIDAILLPGHGDGTNHMAAATAFSFLLIGLSLLLLRANHVVAMQSVVLAAVSIAVLELIGYSYDVETLYGAEALRLAAPYSIVMFIVLAAGLLLARPDRGLMALITSKTGVGVMARRLLPVVLLVPLVLGWLELGGLRRGWYSSALGKGVFAIVNVVVFSGFIWWSLRVLDRTENARRKAEEELRVSEERQRTVVESSPNAIIVTRPNGTIALLNRQAELLFGYAREELIDHPVETLVPPRFRAHHPAYRREFMAHPQQRPMGMGRDLFGIRKDGSEVPIEIALTPVARPEGVFVMATITDITERQRKEQELQKAADELARSNRDLEQFAHVTSHDLQEPLRMIAGHLQLLEKRLGNQMDETSSDSMKFAIDAAMRMQALIHDLLQYARVGRQGSGMAATDMGAALEAALLNVAASIEETGAIVHCEPLPTIWADASLMARLLQNFLSNALKYRSRERRPEISIGASRDANAWRFYVKDNGIGIGSEDLERIFQMFQRLHGREEYPGTGIGLAICKRIVEHHSGRIWVESTPGEGSTFLFLIPDPPIGA